MSRIKDIRIDLNHLEASWLEFLAALFQRLGYQVTARGDRFGMRPQPDLQLEISQEAVIVELKLHRSDRVPLALVRNAFLQVGRLIAGHDAQRGILIIPRRLAESHYMRVRQEDGPPIDLWDLDQLLVATANYPDLGADLAELLRALRIGAERSPEGLAEIAELADTVEELPPVGAGGQIAHALESLSAGKENGAAQEFEKLCEQALKLMFDHDLLGWRRQSDIEEGFQRVDVIARLQPVQSAFWSTLSLDFRTRYVVFEIKNYSGKITQDQIYSTERYLYATALRSVAIVIARNGIAQSAERAVQGALREQGKLILCITGNEFCEMLRGFDNGDNPEELLIRKRDDLLMAIAR